MAIEAFIRMKKYCLLEVQDIVNNGCPEKKEICELNTARVLLGDAVAYQRRYAKLRKEFEERHGNRGDKE